MGALHFLYLKKKTRERAFGLRRKGRRVRGGGEGGEGGERGSARAMSTSPYTCRM